MTWKIRFPRRVQGVRGYSFDEMKNVRNFNDNKRTKDLHHTTSPKPSFLTFKPLGSMIILCRWKLPMSSRTYTLLRFGRLEEKLKSEEV